MIKNKFGIIEIVLTTVSIVVTLLLLYELVENHYFLQSDPIRMHYLFISRGMITAGILVMWSIWFIYRFSRGVENEYKEKNFIAGNIIQNIPDIILIRDENKLITHANQAASELFGKDIVNKSCRDIAHNDDKCCKEFCPVENTLKTGIPCQNEVYNITGKDNKYYSVQTYPIFNENGRIILVVEFMHDITEERALKDQLTHSDKLVTVGQLSAGLAHEINNPLGGAINCVQLMKGNNMPSEKREKYYEMIENALKSIKDLVQEFLNYSRRGELNIKEFNVDDLLKKSLDLVRLRIDKKNICFETPLDANSYTIRGDLEQLSQVIVNLMLNAVEHTDNGGKISIALNSCSCLAEKYREHIHIAIQDTGEGIKKENIDHIFEPFFTTKKSGEGTGLGLPISLRIIQEHGGNIFAQSEYARGTLMNVLLPVTYMKQSRLMEKKS